MLETGLFAALLLTPGVRLVDDNRDGVRLETDLEREERDEVYRVIDEARQEAARTLQQIGVRAADRAPVRLRIYSRTSDYEDCRRNTRDRQTQDYGNAFYNPTDRKIVLTWEGGSEASIGQLRGQCARQVLRKASKEPPAWFEEGFVALFSGARTDPYGDTISWVNRDLLPEIRQAIERATYCPLGELLTLEAVDFFGYAGATVREWAPNLLIAQSWSLTFHLLRRASEPDQAFVDLLARTLSGSRWKPARAQDLLPGLERRWIETVRTDLGDLDLLAQLVEEAWRDLEAGDLQAARVKASKALGEDESLRSARRALAKACQRQGDFEAVAMAFERLVDTGPSDRDALLGYGRSWLEIARTTQSPGALERVVEAGRRLSDLAPPDERHHGLVLCADGYEAIGDLEGALDCIREAARERGIDRETRDELKDRERELLRRVIGKDGRR